MEELTLITSVEPRRPVHATRRGAYRVRALLEPLLMHQRIMRQIIDAGHGEWIGVKLLDLADPDAVRDRAFIRRQRLPIRETLHAWDDEFFRVLDCKGDEKTLSLLLATMLDGFPRGMVLNVQTYVGAALLVLGAQALSPDILAAAIIRIWRRDKFPPSISELLNECESARQSAASVRRVVAKMIALLDNAEEILIATGRSDLNKEGNGT